MKKRAAAGKRNTQQPRRRIAKRNTPRPQSKRITALQPREQLEIPATKQSANAGERSRGLMAVVSVRFSDAVLKALDKLAVKRSEERRWPRTTRSTLVLEGVHELLNREARS